MGEAKRRRALGRTGGVEMTPHAAAAAAMDEHVRRLASEGIRGSALVPRMSGHLMLLQQIYETASDSELLALARRYPNFAAFAEMMEDLSEAERRQAGVTLPAQLAKRLRLQAGQALDARTEDGALILSLPTKPRYALADLIAQCDPKAPRPADLVGWEKAPAVGRELP